MTDTSAGTSGGQALPPWPPSDTGLQGITKREILVFLQREASSEFLSRYGLTGQPKSTLKRATLPGLRAAYQAWVTVEHSTEAVAAAHSQTNSLACKPVAREALAEAREMVSDEDQSIPAADSPEPESESLQMHEMSTEEHAPLSAEQKSAGQKSAEQKSAVETAAIQLIKEGRELEAQHPAETAESISVPPNTEFLFAALDKYQLAFDTLARSGITRPLLLQRCAVLRRRINAEIWPSATFLPLLSNGSNWLNEKCFPRPQPRGKWRAPLPSS